MKEHKGPFNHSKHEKKKNQSSKVKTETRKHPGTAGKGTGMPSPPENVPGKKFSGFVFLQH